MSTVYKIVFGGPIGAGKTCAVKTLSDIEVVSTEAAASDAVRRLKAETTVAMDYGVLNLANGDRVRLYGTPGQERFDFMWEILAENAIGLVLLINGSAPDPIADLHAYVAAFRPFIDRGALVVGVNHTHYDDHVVRPKVAAAMAELGLRPIVMNVDARSRKDMIMLIKALIYSIDPLFDAN